MKTTQFFLLGICCLSACGLTGCSGDPPVTAATSTPSTESSPASKQPLPKGVKVPKNSSIRLD